MVINKKIIIICLFLVAKHAMSFPEYQGALKLKGEIINSACITDADDDFEVLTGQQFLIKESVKTMQIKWHINLKGCDTKKNDFRKYSWNKAVVTLQDLPVSVLLYDKTTTNTSYRSSSLKQNMGIRGAYLNSMLLKNKGHNIEIILNLDKEHGLILVKNNKTLNCRFDYY